MGVGRRYVQQSDVDRDPSPAEKAGNIGEEDGNVFSTPLIDGIACVGTDEQRTMMEMTLHRAVEVGCGSFGMKMDHAYPPNVFGPACKSLEQRRGCSGCSLDECLLTRFEAGQRGVSVDQLH
jgi:hypothetical protein